MDRIEIRGLTVRGHHGVHEDERERGQEFVIDVEAALDLADAGETDDLSRTLDYGPLVKEIHRVASAERYFLLEALAERIAAIVLEDQRVVRAVVRVAKPAPPVDAQVQYVAAVIERPR